MREDFVGYMNITGDTTGLHIAESIISRLQAINLDPSNLRAQAYDGTGNISTFSIFLYFYTLYIY